MKKLIIGMLVLLVACTTLPYKDDVGFLVSAQANSPESPVYINGKLCKDMDGNPGMCSKRIRSNDDVKLHFDPQSYPYEMTVRCSSPLKVPPQNVPANAPLDVVIPADAFKGMPSFVCIGEIFPADRDQPMSHKWEIRVVITDMRYAEREQMQFVKKHGKNYLVLGQYARTSWVFDGKEWKQYNKKTAVKVKDPSKVKAYSESMQSRFNFLNMDEPVQATEFSMIGDSNE